MGQNGSAPPHPESLFPRPARREIWPVPPAAFTAENRVDGAALQELVDFYVEAGADGLFILAYSGEAFEVTSAERVAICRRAVRAASGRLPIVAAGNLGGDLNRQIDHMNELADTGLDGVVALVSTLTRPERAVADLREMAERVSAPLGVYECPAPEHRLLSAGDVEALAATGRYTIMKETSRNRMAYRQKLAAAQGSPLKVMPANFGQLPGAIADGCPGFCGIIASAFPELVNAYCNDRELPPPAREALHAVLSEILQCMTRRHYPATLKYVLQRRGVEIGDRSRMATGLFVDGEDRRRLDEALDRLQLLDTPRAVLDRVLAGEALAAVRATTSPVSTEID
ncbi:MAG: dihydrodipicolinate synthase family protein [Pirellulales bacterium]|nr:dihydrodipicolinate synthase family protein [Pirellulales bacterium]